jgi:seryl-tRNA synthetase
MADEALLEQCEFGRGRGAGPGGQHRNKVETAVTLTHRPTGISAQAGERRSQIENKRMALRRLRLALATLHREPVPIGEIGSDLWHARRKGSRLVISSRHRDYPAMLAEALDAIADGKWGTKKASIRLEVSASQLLKLVKEHPPALSMWNEQRAARGLRPLR